MDKYLNSRGSEWNKWDLHIHSPSTILNNCFKGDWDGYFERLESLEGFVALGITDYYNIDGYLKVKEAKKNGRLSNIDLILPNIEFRLDLPTQNRRAINYHVIFSPEVDQYIQEYFLNELEFQHAGRHYKCNRTDLKELGKVFNKNGSEESLLIEGTNQYKVSIEEIVRVLNKHSDRFKGKYILVAPNSSGDGLSGLRQTQFLGIKQNIYHSSHAIFSSSKQDREFFLGISKGQEAVKDLCGKLMPCIHGSDAHELDKIGKPDDNRFTWIKANPTFEGLYQILFEPESRVIVQQESPNQKLDYNVIEKVQFVEHEDFQERQILFNSGLNTIIGGKSSGKSLLLYKMAKAISKEEVNLRETDEIWKNTYKETFIEDVNFRVYWRDGRVTDSKLEEQIGRITYIPQMYINALSEETGNEVLQNKVLDILSENTEVQMEIEQNEQVCNDYEKQIHKLSFELNALVEKKKDLENEKRGKISLESIISQKSSFESELDHLLFESEVCAEDEKLISDIFEVIEKEKMKKRELNKDIIGLVKYEKNIENMQVQVKNLNEEFREGNKPVLRNKAVSLEKDINKVFDLYKEEIETDKSDIKGIIARTDVVVSDLEKYLEIFEDKMKSKEKVSRLRLQIKQEEEKIRDLEELEIEILEVSKSINKQKKRVIDELEAVFNSQLELVSTVDNIPSINDINIKAKLIFNQKKFEAVFLNYFNLRMNLEQIIEVSIIDTHREFVFNPDNYIENIEKLLEIVLELPKERFKKAVSLSDIIASLTKVYTELFVEIEKDRDLISEMSPGKRGLVLLELFLSITNETHPILIDQPEDNLDNRTISTELVSFIREKSRERQIILVTHNANLVILTDSDNVIVANQDVQLIENSVNRFEYINGSLECDFNLESSKISSRGIKSHACEILEGGPKAFNIREKKYGL